ncbi:MAG TPA: hypothetical protein VHB50_23075 [Bryobacteraceae bacterium]|nr:hypothetical protein [Bryobacteraceae bacterium]
MTGAAALSLLVFAFCALRVARVPIFLACGARLDNIDAGLQQIHNQPTGDLRRLATATVKARGIDYLVIGGEFTGPTDMGSPAGGRTGS